MLSLNLRTTEAVLRARQRRDGVSPYVGYMVESKMIRVLGEVGTHIPITGRGTLNDARVPR
jgi:hypothetical protein